MAILSIVNPPAVGSQSERQTLDSGFLERPTAPSLSRRLLALVVLTAASLVLFAAPTPASAHPTTPAVGSSYEVRSGDSLSIIARDHGIALTELAAANGISNVHLIRVGQVLQIPSLQPASYTVSPGDSLSVIAKSIGISTADLVEMNGLTNADVIKVGQTLQLPAGSSVSALSPTVSYKRLPSKLMAAPERLNLLPSFERWSAHYGVDPALLMSVAYRESGWQTDVVSSSGAVGVGQIMPKTGEWIAADLIGEPGLDRWNADDNIRMSAKYLSWLSGYMGSTDLALAAYYQGPGAVRAVGLYDDTVEYVDNVNALRPYFQAG